METGHFFSFFLFLDKEKERRGRRGQRKDSFKKKKGKRQQSRDSETLTLQPCLKRCTDIADIQSLVSRLNLESAVTHSSTRQ